MIAYAMDHTLYQILLWTCPVLLAVIAFFLRQAAAAFQRMSKDINEIKVQQGIISVRQDHVEEAVDKFESMYSRIEKLLIP